MAQVTANNEYKLKQWNADNKSCRRTTIGPTFGGPINRLEQINHIHTDGQSRPTEFVAYGTADKVVGLVSLTEESRAQLTSLRRVRLRENLWFLGVEKTLQEPLQWAGKVYSI